MKLKDAVSRRVQELCDNNNLTVHGMSLKTGVANSTLADMVTMTTNGDRMWINFAVGGIWKEDGNNAH